MKKLLSLVIALAMVIAMVPIGASAEDFNFTTFAELKEIIANAGNNWQQWEYVSSEPLIIEEDITLPANVMLSFGEASTIVAEGATLTAVGQFFAEDLIVNGTFVNRSHQCIYNTLTVNGAVTNYGVLSMMNPDVVVAGEDKITHVDGGCISWVYEIIDSVEELAAILADAEADSDPNIHYIINFFGAYEGTPAVDLAANLVVPANTELQLYSGVFTLPAGCVLSVNGYLALCYQTTLNVEGTLINNRHISVLYHNSSLLQIAENGTYEGKGEIRINSNEEKIDAQTAVPGLDISLFPYVYEESYGWWLTHVNPNGGGGGDSSDMEFSTFAELKDILANPGTEWAYAVYQGSEPLVIEEDITIPENLMVQSYAVPVIVPEGVTVTAEGQFGACELTVNGTYVNQNYLYVSDSLTVNGTLTNNGLINLNSTASVTGMDKIVDAGGRFQWEYYIKESVEELAAALDTAASDPGTYYHITIEGSYDSVSVIELGADLTVPANTVLLMHSADYTVPTGCTLRVLGTLWLESNGKLNVLGTLSNEGDVNVGYPYGGLLNMEQGTYEGTGRLYIYSWGETFEKEAAVPGLDISQFPYVYEEDWGWWMTYENMNGGGGGSYGTEFASFDELKELIANADDEWAEWFYVGSEPLAITEDITIPENKILICRDVPLEVAEGATLTVDSNVNADEMIVNGKLVNNQYVAIYALLTVNGAIENQGCLSLDSGCSVVGMEKITHVDYGYLEWTYWVQNIDQLAEVVDIAAADTSATHYIVMEAMGQSVVFKPDMVLPANTTLTLHSGTYTVPAGSTLTANGDLWLYGPLNVEGTLVNNGFLMVEYTYEGLLNMTGTYTGEGEVYIYSYDEKIDIETAAPGLDVSYFPYVYEKDWGWWMTHNDYNGDGGGNHVEITSFEELVAVLTEVGDDMYFEVVYAGSEPLTIEDDITIPANVTLFVHETGVVVPENVTLTVDGVVYANIVTINGEVVNNRAFYALQELTVSGKLVNNYVLVLMNTTKLVGVDKIEYGIMEDGRPAQLQWNWSVTTEDEIKEAIDEAVANADNPSYWYAVAMYNENELTLTEDMTIPYQMQLLVAGGPFTVAEGATLTLEGGMIIQQSPVTVKGKLVSNKNITVYNFYGGTLNIADSGSYSSKGDIWVYVENADSDLAAAVPGIDLSNAMFVATQGGYLIPGTEEEHTHEWGEGTVTTPATCTAEGVLTYTCECGETKTEAIPATGHAEVTDEAKAPTCTETGLTEGKHCSVCGEVLVKQETVAATGHSFGEWVTVVEPTTTTEGKAERKCACGETETKVLPILYTVPDVETSVSDSEFMEKLEDAADNAYIVAEVTGETDLPETVFEAISGTDKLLELVSEDVTWQFHGKDIVNESKEIDLSVEIAKAEDSAQEIEEKLSENPGVVMKFAENGQLPGKATIQVKLDEDLKTYLGESDKLCVYYYNEETDELELIAENLTVIDGTYVEFAITHCSYYVLTTEIKTEEEQLPKLGDVNNDGRLNAKDATLILRYSVKKYTDYPDWFEQIADVNDDGRVNAKDATLILRFVVNKADIPGWEK